MLKKLMTVLLCAVLSLSVLAGCTLFEKDTEADMSQVVASIDAHTFSERVLKDEYKDKTPEELGQIIDDGIAADPNFTVYVTKEIKTQDRKITKYSLLQAVNQNASSSQAESVEKLFEDTLTQLVNRELLLLECERLMQLGDLARPTLTQVNNIRKSIYDALDDGILDQMIEIAEDFDEEAPVKPTPGEAKEPQYAVKTVKEAEEDINTDTELWLPDSRAPKAGDTLKLEGVRKYVAQLYKLLDQQKFLLTGTELEIFNAGKKAFEDHYASAKNEDLVGLYELLGNFKVSDADGTLDFKMNESDTPQQIEKNKIAFAVYYVFYEYQYQNLLLENLEKSVKNKTVVSDSEVMTYISEQLKAQIQNYADKTKYTTALDDNKVVKLTNPHDVKQFYVKHILVPFSDEQIKLFKNGETVDKTKREKEALVIKSYEHKDGYDNTDKGLIDIADIRANIYAQMKTKAGNSYAAEMTFEDLIFKYNTDPGIFNNAVGYGLRYDEKSSYMAEFEEVSKELYEDYLEKGDAAIGTVRECTTDYGIHFVMLSSVVQPKSVSSIESLNVNAYTDVMKTQTIFESMKETKETSAKTNAFSTYTYTLLQKLEAAFGDGIEKFPDRYKDLIKQASGS